MCDTSKLAEGIRGRRTQPEDERKDHKAESGLGLSGTKDTRPGGGNVQGLFGPQWGSSLADSVPRRGDDRGLQPPHSPATCSTYFPYRHRGIQLDIARKLCVIVQKRSCDFLIRTPHTVFIRRHHQTQKVWTQDHPFSSGQDSPWRFLSRDVLGD